MTYTRINNDILNAAISPNEHRVYAILCSFAYGKKKTCFPGLQKISEKMGRSIRTVQRTIKKLADRGLITVTRRGNTKTNFYTIHDKIEDKVEVVSTTSDNSNNTDVSETITGEVTNQAISDLQKLVSGNTRSTTYKDTTYNKLHNTYNKSLRFANFTQREYDYDSLERQLLGIDPVNLNSIVKK